jgi:hypothetical protein
LLRSGPLLERMAGRNKVGDQRVERNQSGFKSRQISPLNEHE